jgi:hypothetical protein
VFIAIKGLKQKIIIVVASITMTACATQLVYRNLDWLILEYLDDYVTLDNEQEALFKLQLNKVIDWHQQNELDKYLAQIDELIALNPDEVDESFVLSQQQQFRGHITRLAQKLAPDLYSMSMFLSEEQAKEFFDNYAEKNQEYYEKRIDISIEEQDELYLERLVENWEKWLGSLTSEQEGLIETWASEALNTRNEWYEYRVQTQDELKTLFARRDQPFYFQPKFMEIVTNPESRYSPTLASKLEYNNQITIQYTLILASTATSKQWEHFKKELQTWRKRIESLK